MPAPSLAASTLTLARWSGPWSDASVSPPDVERRELVLPGDGHGRRPLRGWLYLPRTQAPLGAWLVAPGLHPAGPADPRFERLCRVLAASGHAVLAPFLRDWQQLTILPRAFDEFARFAEHLYEHPVSSSARRLALFSISWGSLLALRLAGDRRFADRVSHVVTFGGYRDWRAAVRFSLDGGATGAGPDLRNLLVAYLNLRGSVAGLPDDERLAVAWVELARTTWGRAERRNGPGFAAEADRLASALPLPLRRPFLWAAHREDGLERALDAIDRADLPFLDPGSALGNVRSPVTILHGAADEVISVEQAQALATDLAHVRPKLLVSGLFGHTAQHRRWTHPLRALPLAAREAWTLAHMAHDLASAPRTSLPSLPIP